MKVILAYIPVPHRGYKEFFSRHSDASQVYLVGQELLNEFAHLRKNLPALSPLEVQEAINAMGWIETPICIASQLTLNQLSLDMASVIVPYEDVSLGIVEKYLQQCEIEFDNYFLRWDKINTLAKQDVVPNSEISTEEFDYQVFSSLDANKDQSSDFWRQVAAAVVKDGEVAKYAYNSHVPDPEDPYFFGDPRFNFSRGVAIELSTAEHAEAKLIAMFACEGVALKGASLYVTTFPCPVCAKLIATAGFSKCYFREGYSMLDAEIILRAANIELIQVK